MSGFGEHVDRLVYLAGLDHAALISRLLDLDPERFAEVFADYPAWRAHRPAAPVRQVGEHLAVVEPEGGRRIPGRPRPRHPLRPRR